MSARPHVTTGERRARLAVRHHLAPAARVATLVDAARGVVALHSTDPATVFLSARARMSDATIPAIEHELYEDRTALRMMGMRRTLWVVPLELVPHMQAGASNAIAASERKRVLQWLAQDAVGGSDPEAWFRDLERRAVEILARHGDATTAELTRDEPEMRTKLVIGKGKPYEAEISISTRVFLIVGLEGLIARTRPRGTWISSQYRWAPIERWFPDGMPAVPAPEAQIAVVRRYLERFGPVTLADIRWWTGWTARDVKAALATIGPAEVDLDEGTGFLLPDDTEPIEPPASPWVALLPALDPTTMGWQARDWYLGPHRPALFDTNGNAGPTVWVDGRVVGGWGQRRDGAIVWKLLEDVGAETERAIEAEAQRIRAFQGDTVVTPRFRTPTEVELGV